MKARLKKWLKAFVLRFCPSVYHRRVARHERSIFQERFFPFQTEVSRRLFRDGEIKVLAGPFAGMKYFNEVFYFSAVPRWLGTYEMELHDIVEEIINRKYQTIIDVGSAEGYYAVGMAMRCPRANVHAYDVDPWSRDQCRRLSQLNRVDERVRVRGWLRSGEISRLASQRTLVISDIEGHELSLLDPQTCPALLRCDLLVEVHESAGSSVNVEATLLRRFTTTHQIKTIEAADRPVAAAASLFPADSPADEIKEAMEEYRPECQHWLWMVRRNGV